MEGPLKHRSTMSNITLEVLNLGTLIIGERTSATDCGPPGQTPTPTFCSNSERLSSRDENGPKRAKPTQKYEKMFMTRNAMNVD